MDPLRMLPLAAGESPLGFLPEVAALLALSATAVVMQVPAARGSRRRGRPIAEGETSIEALLRRAVATTARPATTYA